MHDETCPHCNGPALPLGTLGALTHYRCRNCGWTFAETVERDEEDLG
jgi:rubredoxin